MAEVRSSLGADHSSLREKIFDELRTRIVSNELPPGTRMVESHLADDLGVSRNPVRESIRMLEAAGFVHVLPRRGAVVAQLSSTQALELFQVRSELEGLAARLAARNASTTELTRLEKLLAEGARAVTRPEPKKLSELNARFHALVADLSGNSTLSQLTSQLRDRLEWVFIRTASTRAEESWNEHRLLVAAILNRDEDTAESLARGHIAEARHAFEERQAAIAQQDPTTRNLRAKKS